MMQLLAALPHSGRADKDGKFEIASQANADPIF